ncbi:MAG: helix-turn-helix transcriptional regulator [Planctomycetota bacterium]|nr:helix-turn-helix transcriptional regulator [Planctomycetota bacterium]
MIAPNTPVLEDVRNEFTRFLPELSGRLSRRFRHRRPEARAEAVAEGVAHAWVLYVSASQRQKSVTPGTLAHYSGRMVESGRKVAGNSTVDALADTPLSRGRVGRHVSLDSPGVAAAVFFKTFGDRRWRWPVLDCVAPHLDLEAFLTGCTARERRLIGMRLAGYQQTEIAAKLNVSPPAINQWLAGLRRRWETPVA